MRLKTGRRLAALCSVAGLFLGALPAGAQTSEPAYPSPEWFAREAANYAMTTQAPSEQASDPDFQMRWEEQNLENRRHYFESRYLDGTWPWDSTGNLCNTWSGPCTGDPYRYPGVDPFYENEGDVEEVVYFDADGALLSGRVWAPKGAQPGDDLPGVVIETGSVQAPETLYWWFAQTLVRNGYVVMTYDVRGQGRSDNRDPSGRPGSNFDSTVFASDLVDSIELFLSTPEAPYPHGFSRDGAELTPHNPFHDLIDPGRLGIVGHSLGATGVSVVQGIEEWPGRLLDENPVDVAIAWDNLAASGSLDGHSVEPRVPTMGQSGDYYLTPTPFTSPPDPQGKNAGFNRWKGDAMPSYQVNIRGGTHYEWSLLPGFPTTSWDGWGNPLADHYSLAWLDRWLKEPCETGFADADERLLSDADWTERMSFYYTSARAYPVRGGTQEDCDDIKGGCVPASSATAVGLSSEAGSEGTVTATVTTVGEGSPVVGGTVVFCSGLQEISSATTDGSGRATIDAPASGVTAVFLGGTGLRASSS